MQHSLPERKKSWFMRFKDYWLGEWFNPNTSFLKLPSFWGPFAIIGLSFVLLLWKVAGDQELVWGLDATVEQWYEWFKIPFWVLALLIPVIGLFNANHKSEQARAAMELTRSQNNFANYYKHLEEFEKFCRVIEKDYSQYKITISDRVLHKLFFPSMRVGDPKIPTIISQQFENYSVNVESFSRDLGGEIAKLDNAPVELSFLVAEAQMITVIAELNRYVKISEKEGENSTAIGAQYKKYESSLNIITDLYVHLTVIRRAMEFDQNFYGASFNSIDVLESRLSTMRATLTGSEPT